MIVIIQCIDNPIYVPMQKNTHPINIIPELDKFPMSVPVEFHHQVTRGNPAAHVAPVVPVAALRPSHGGIESSRKLPGGGRGATWKIKEMDRYGVIPWNWEIKYGYIWYKVKHFRKLEFKSNVL